MAFDLLNALRAKEIVSIQGDRVMGDSARERAQLFGHAVELPAGPFILAQVAEVPIYPLFIVRLGYRAYKIIVYPPIAYATQQSEDRQQDIAAALSNGRLCWKKSFGIIGTNGMPLCRLFVTGRKPCSLTRKSPGNYLPFRDAAKMAGRKCHPSEDDWREGYATAWYLPISYFFVADIVLASGARLAIGCGARPSSFRSLDLLACCRLFEFAHHESDLGVRPCLQSFAQPRAKRSHRDIDDGVRGAIDCRRSMDQLAWGALVGGRLRQPGRGAYCSPFGMTSEVSPNGWIRRGLLAFALLAPIWTIAFVWHNWLIALVPLFVSHLLILYPTLMPNSQWWGPVLCGFATDRREVWLTIDDGPTNVQTGAILDLLDRYEARATFFVIGTKAAQARKSARRFCDAVTRSRTTL